MSDVLVRGALGILTGLRGVAERMQGDIRIRDGRIAEIGDLRPAPGESWLDARDCVILPGLVCTHHHLFQSVMKGVPSGMDLGLEGWLRSVPYQQWHKLDEDALEVAAIIGMAELLLSGTTTVADHHYLFADSYDFDPAALIFEVAGRLGIRMVLCRGGATRGRSFDIPGTFPMPIEKLETMLHRVSDLASRYHDPAPDAMRRVVLAPTTPPRSLAPEEMRAVVDAAHDMKLLLHGHLSETSGCVDFVQETYGMRPVQWLADHGWLGQHLWLAHLVHADDSELRLLAESGTGMAHCPRSNCRLGSGVAPADRLDALGGRVSLGVDGAASNEACDMVNEMHVGWLMHRAVKGPGALRAEDMVRWASAGGADVLGLPAVGTIAVGQAADLAVFDLSQPRYAGLHDPLIGPVIGGGGARPRHVLVGGRPVVRDGAIPGLDLSLLAVRAQRAVGRMAA